MKKLYKFEGAVFSYGGNTVDRCLERNWSGTTIAVSEAQARNNLTYQYKKEHNLPVDMKLFISGEVRSTKDIYGIVSKKFGTNEPLQEAEQLTMKFYR